MGKTELPDEATITEQYLDARKRVIQYEDGHLAATAKARDFGEKLDVARKEMDELSRQLSEVHRAKLLERQ